LHLIFKNVSKEIVLIIGGPGSGKTTLINGLAEKGYICYPEISREVTLEAQQQGIEQLFLTDPLLFSQMLLNGRVKQFENASKEPEEIVFIDRGIPDVLAYMHYIGDSYPTDFDLACKKHTYNRIFLLPPWESIYESDEARYENFEQAQLIHHHLVSTYESYGYQLIEVPRVTVNDRIDFIINKI